jgi:hypothetical protein
MPRVPRQAAVISVVLLVASVASWTLMSRARATIPHAGFWFDDVTYDRSEAMVARLGGPLGAEELAVVQQVAKQEVAQAFQGLRMVVSDGRESRYQVRVVQHLRNLRFPNYPGPSGESRAIPGLGGVGAVSFRTLANNAIAHAPAGATRMEMVAAIGRGVGRAAVHEFAHQMLSAPIDGWKDVQTYEFGNADRREQYYGPMRWGMAWPLLQARLGNSGT